MSDTKSTLAPSFGFLLVITVASRLPLFFVSFFSGDEATYSALAARLLTGVLPYQGATDHKPPGMMLIYAGIYAIVGRYRLSFVRLLEMGVIALTAQRLGKIAEKLDLNARVSVLFFVFASIWGFPSDTMAANTEIFLNLALTVAAEKTLDENSGSLFVAGILTGFAGLLKYQAALAGAAWAIVVMRRHRWQLALPLAGGFLVVAVLYVGFFFYSRAWDDFCFWGWAFNAQYVTALSAGEFVRNAAMRTGFCALNWLPLLACAAQLRRPPRILVAWLVCMSCAIAVGGRFFGHYYLMALPPLCLWAGIPTVSKGWVRLGILLTIGWTAVAWRFYDLKPHLREYDRTYHEVAAFVRAQSDPEDRIFVWGNSPEIYVLSNRVMATRFAFCNYHTGKIWGTPLDDVDAPSDLTYPYRVPRAWTELFEDLRTTSPRLLIDAAAGRLDRFDLHSIDRYPQLAKVVASDYSLIGTPGGVPVYRHR